MATSYGVLGHAEPGSPVPEGNMTMPGQETKHDPELDVELGEQVDVAPRKRKGAALVAVRLSADLLERVDEYARANGLTLSDVLRQGAERVIAGPTDAGPFIASSTIVFPGTGQFQALPSGGQGRSEQIASFGEERPDLTLAG
jgi:hypothetical protein